MLKTEQDARQGWCPFARLVPIDVKGENRAIMAGIPAGYNRGAPTNVPNAVQLPDASRCIGSECMAWRWRYQSKMNPADIITGPPLASHGAKPEEWTPLGFCGLAGAP